MSNKHKNKKTPPFENLVATAIGSGMTIEHELFKHKVLEILKDSVQEYKSPQTYYDYIKTIFEKVEKL